MKNNQSPSDHSNSGTLDALTETVTPEQQLADAKRYAILFADEAKKAWNEAGRAIDAKWRAETDLRDTRKQLEAALIRIANLENELRSSQERAERLEAEKVR